MLRELGLIKLFRNLIFIHYLGVKLMTLSNILKILSKLPSYLVQLIKLFCKLILWASGNFDPWDGPSFLLGIVFHFFIARTTSLSILMNETFLYAVICLHPARLTATPAKPYTPTYQEPPTYGHGQAPAQYIDRGDDEEMRYSGYINPGSQSRSFKMLQSLTAEEEAQMGNDTDSRLSLILERLVTQDTIHICMYSNSDSDLSAILEWLVTWTQDTIYVCTVTCTSVPFLSDW